MSWIEFQRMLEFADRFIRPSSEHKNLREHGALKHRQGVESNGLTQLRERLLMTS